MLCAAAGVATGEQVPTPRVMYPHYLYTIYTLASGSRRYHNSFYTMLYTGQLLTTHPCPAVALAWLAALMFHDLIPHNTLGPRMQMVV